MNIQCIICSDLFSPASEIYSTNCGHFFHYVCLIQWLERSKTCPQCRHKCTEKTMHRIFPNLANTENVEDVGILTHKVDGLTFQIKQKDKAIKNQAEKYNVVKKENISLREHVKSLEDKGRVADSVMFALKDQIKFFKAKSKDSERMSVEMQRLKDRLKNMESLEVAVNGTQDQVVNMLKQNRDPESLSLLVTQLKKELIETDRKKKYVSSKLANEVAVHKKDVADLEKELESLRSIAECHKYCDKEKRYLKSKLMEVQKKVSESAESGSYTPDRSTQRILTESPAPLQPSLNDAVVDLATLESPTVAERVQSIEDSNSPYLPIKLQNGGITGLLNAKYCSLKDSQMAKPSAGTSNLYESFQIPKVDITPRSDDYSYNGLGGHSKPDLFPSKQRESILKRPKSSSSIPSHKFRKLSTNAKIDDFAKH